MMTEEGSEGIQLDPISREMWLIVTRRQQLLSRRSVLLEAQKFLQNSRGGKGCAEEEEDEDESELERVEKELQSLSEKEKEVIKRMWEKQVIQQEAAEDTSVSEGEPSERKRGLRIISGVYILPSPAVRQSLVTEQPASGDKDPTPTGPPPGRSEGVVEVQDLSRVAATVRCPTCEETVTTEIHYRVGKSSFLLCLFSSLLCCVAGCCLLPFFLDYFKDTIHKCPSCHTEIHTVRRL